MPGDLVRVWDHAGRFEVLKEVLLSVEFAGATDPPGIIHPMSQVEYKLGAVRRIDALRPF